MATTTTNFGWDIPQSTDLVKDGATAIAALGQDIDTALIDLKGGTTGQVLSKASNTDLDYTWVTDPGGDITGVSAGTGISGGGTSGTVTVTNSMATAIDAKGDLIGGTGADAFSRLAVGANETRLVADSTQATGLKYVADTTNYAIAAKGNLLAGTAADTLAALTVGANGTVLTADSVEATGMKWATPSTGGTFADYTPTFTNFTIGNGTINFARYVQIGKFVTVYGKVTLGSTSSMGTSPKISLPVTGTSNMSGIGWVLGAAVFGDTGTGSYEGYIKTSSTTVAELVVGNSSGTHTQASTITSAVPMTWANTDTFLWNFTYEAA